MGDEGAAEEKKVSSVESSSDEPAAVPFVQRAATAVSEGLEQLFFNLGFAVASRPWTVILCTFFVSALFGLGMIRFEQKDSSEPIWIPKDSQVLKNQERVEEMFPIKHRYNVLIITADNVLDPAVIKQMYEVDLQVKNLSEVNNSDPILNFEWTSICIKLRENCWSNSILELWQFDGDAIRQLDSVTQVVAKIATTPKSPVYGFDFTVSDWLGDITYDTNGEILRAGAAKMLYVIQATSPNELDTRVVGPDLLWETKFIDLGTTLDEDPSPPIQEIHVSAVRSFRDESDNSFAGDVTLLMVGVGVIVSYVAVILGKFNEVEHKVYLALVGVFGIGLASLVSYGFASAIGMFYGPIHPILPFLLLGLGVDDMFVIIEAWNNLKSYQQKSDLRIKIASTMKHAGVSITVTSVTDFVAFAIGATTSLPALKSFCVYAALGILSLFIIQSTFFVAWLTIDQRRQDASRDACCIWIKYVDFEPNSCSQRTFLPWCLKKFLAPFLISLPIKVLVMSTLTGMLVISGYGAYQLRTDSDLSWFLPTNSYFTRFLHTQDLYFGNGVPVNLYIGKVNYFDSKNEISNLTAELLQSPYVRGNEIRSWHAAFLTWLPTEEAGQVAYYFSVERHADGYPVSKEGYYTMLNSFVGTSGQQYYESLKWNDTNPQAYREVEASKMGFTLQDFPTSEDDSAALEFVESLCMQYFGDEAFVWSINLRNYETNRVIQDELYMNIGLAFLAVFIVTLLLVANLPTCILVCLCVVFTLVNVCGFMHFWGLTIDTLTSILLILSIGLAIDYSAHVGHTFMTIHGTRNVRARRTIATIGAAVINGGFSTFLAFILLATSTSYVFITFFKVFFLVIVFGLFNGICVLPVLLSWFGPMAYLNARSGVQLTSLLPMVSMTLPTDSIHGQHSRPVHSSYPKVTNHPVGSDVNETLPNLKLLHSGENYAHEIEMQDLGNRTGEALTSEQIILECEEYLQKEQKCSNVQNS